MEESTFAIPRVLLIPSQRWRPDNEPPRSALTKCVNHAMRIDLPLSLAGHPNQQKSEISLGEGSRAGPSSHVTVFLPAKRNGQGKFIRVQGPS